MQVLHYQRKALTSTQQRFYIHVEFASNNHLNDSHTVFPNSIFDTILKAYHPWFTPPFPSPCHIPLSINIPSVQHMTQHVHNETSLPQEIDAQTHHRFLLTAWNNTAVFKELFQKWFYKLNYIYKDSETSSLPTTITVPFSISNM
jgi:hypothetical protein